MKLNTHPYVDFEFLSPYIDLSLVIIGAMWWRDQFVYSFRATKEYSHFITKITNQFSNHSYALRQPKIWLIFGHSTTKPLRVKIDELFCWWNDFD